MPHVRCPIACKSRESARRPRHSIRCHFTTTANSYLRNTPFKSTSNDAGNSILGKSGFVVAVDNVRVERVTVYCRTHALWRHVSEAHLPACTENFSSLAELAHMGVRQGSRPVVDGPCTHEGQEQRRARQWSVSGPAGKWFLLPGGGRRGDRALPGNGMICRYYR